MKAFWKSLTIWFNTIIGSLTAMIPLAMEQLPVLKEYLPTNWYMWALVFLTFGNVIIRARTNTAIGMRDA